VTEPATIIFSLFLLGMFGHLSVQLWRTERQPGESVGKRALRFAIDSAAAPVAFLVYIGVVLFLLYVMGILG
jgi:hypothetical protein